MKSPLELTAIKMVAGGDALARHPDGRLIMLGGALPGERVLAREVQRKRDFVRAETVTIVERSPARRAVSCPQLTKGCGGCDWQHVNPAAQLRLKTEVVQDALERTGRIAGITVAAGASIAELGYRTTLRLAVDRQGAPGFRAARSRSAVPTDHCPVAHPRLQPLLETVRLPGARELVLRVGARSGDRVAWWSPASAKPAHPLPDDVGTGEDAFVREVVDGVELRVSARAFFQSSPEAAELIAAAVRRAAGDPAEWQGDVVVDAYGGIGALAATATPPELPVVVVESNPAACADAVINLRHRDAQVINQAVERWRPCRAGMVVADPARAGLGSEAVERLCATGARRLVLVSCDAVSFARDARLLQTAGLRLLQAEVLDPFPNTHHLEVVGAFAR